VGPWPFCSDCGSRLTPLEPPWCERCGRPFAKPVARCRDCPPESVTSARAPFAFDGPARTAIHRLKFAGWRGVADALARAMVTAGSPDVDVVTWVPLARRRLTDRGYDQARLLAQGVAAVGRIPCTRLLHRPVAGGPQAQRSGSERRAALQGAFRATGPSPARVLLVDDVLTTGATAGACGEALRVAGAREVHLLAAARSFAGSRQAVRPMKGVVGRAYTRPGPRPGLWLPGDHPR
jgi:predicted amidophosphoribosyltransferase